MQPEKEHSLQKRSQSPRKRAKALRKEPEPPKGGRLRKTDRTSYLYLMSSFFFRCSSSSSLLFIFYSSFSFSDFSSIFFSTSFFFSVISFFFFSSMLNFWSVPTREPNSRWALQENYVNFQPGLCHVSDPDFVPLRIRTKGPASEPLRLIIIFDSEPIQPFRLPVVKTRSDFAPLKFLCVSWKLRLQKRAIFPSIGLAGGKSV